MELRHLRYFVAVAEALSFRRAVEGLRLAQPSLSRQIRDLEAEIGEPLFDRERKQVTLTAAGRALLGEARTLLTGAAAAVQMARNAGRNAQETLHIGSIGVLSALFLPCSLATFREQHPRVDIEVLELGLDEQVAALRAGKIQVGFQARTPGTPSDARFTEQSFLKSPLMVVLPERHPMASAAALSLGALTKEKFLQLEPRPGAGYDRWVRTLCEKAGGFTPQFRQPAVGNIKALFGMVAAGQGLALLPEIVTRRVDGEADWVAKVLRSRRLHLQVAAVWNPASPSVAANNYLALLFKQARTAQRKAAPPRK